MVTAEEPSYEEGGSSTSSLVEIRFLWLDKNLIIKEIPYTIFISFLI